jgi:hypothetical protein
MGVYKFNRLNSSIATGVTQYVVWMHSVRGTYSSQCEFKRPVKANPHTHIRLDCDCTQNVPHRTPSKMISQGHSTAQSPLYMAVCEPSVAYVAWLTFSDSAPSGYHADFHEGHGQTQYSRVRYRTFESGFK